MQYATFLNQFNYNPALAGYVGVERECFIVDKANKIVPAAPQVLTALDRGIQLRPWHPHWAQQIGAFVKNRDGAFGYELSACQIESRVGPCELDELATRLQTRQHDLDAALQFFGLSALHTEVGPEDMPLDVYPDPTGRYQKIVEGLPVEILRAACRVTATHIHVGMPDHETALRVYNHVIQYYGELCELGNGSFGERLAIYRMMAPDYHPQPYASWEAYYESALEKGFAGDPRKCWTLIRISKHGTIEFRMFGATADIGRIVTWATRCHEICRATMMERAA